MSSTRILLPKGLLDLVSCPRNRYQKTLVSGGESAGLIRRRNRNSYRRRPGGCRLEAGGTKAPAGVLMQYVEEVGGAERIGGYSPPPEGCREAAGWVRPCSRHFMHHPG